MDLVQRGEIDQVLRSRSADHPVRRRGEPPDHDAPVMARRFAIASREFQVPRSCALEPASMVTDAAGGT